MVKPSTKLSINTNKKFWVIIPAAGSGQRMGSQIPKQYLKLGVLTLLETTLNVFLNHSNISGIVVAVNQKDTHWLAIEKCLKNNIMIVEGGETRAQSVLNGLNSLSDIAHKNDWVLVHDAARPFVSHFEINQLISELQDDDVGGLLALPIRDTLKKVDQDHNVVQTVDRDHLWQALTPQMFRYELLHRSLTTALENQMVVTDEASAVEFSGFKPKVVRGSFHNIKITFPEDLELLRRILNCE